MLFLAVLVEVGAALGLYFATGHVRLGRSGAREPGRGASDRGRRLKVVSQGKPRAPVKQIAARSAPRAAAETGLGVRRPGPTGKARERRGMGYVVPFMNNKGGIGKSVLARAYAVEAAQAGASVLVADLDDVQRTSKRWADHRRANGLTPDIKVEVATPRVAFDLSGPLGRSGDRHAGLDGSREPQAGALVDLLRHPLAGQSHGRSFGDGAAPACAEGRRALRTGASAWR